ncbi:MAG: aspartate 1-decarboxylase (aspartate alpha-decarboxylase) [Peptoniphilaceae bacterium]|nr:aspartate 1-decarboxylase (aspartate alpha-decarboxylase) [Peptoniphilaceae bacterium]MDY6019427.1 aspartate 1-decarboxylase (aspartate alpha-decarboxylase) [Anaerococcus sp.]
MKDFFSGREINIKEKVLIVGSKVYAKESYMAFDTRRLEGYPPKIYYDNDENLLGKMYDNKVYELEDIEDILITYSDTCFSNHDLDDLREYLIKKRQEFYRKLENEEIT